MSIIVKKVLKNLIWLLVRPVLFFIESANYKVILWRTDRIGHLALNTHLFCIRRKINHDERKFLILSYSKVSNNVSNLVLWEMFCKYFQNIKGIKVVKSTFISYVFTVLKDRLNRINLLYVMDYKCREKEFSLGLKSVHFSNKQKKLGLEALPSIVKENQDKIVCIYARDSTYLDNINPSQDWGYHNYRDSNIENYKKSILYLISKGYTVVRIGSEYSKSLSLKNRKYFEYNLSHYKSDFLDVFLCYIAKFIIGSRSGITDLSLLFETPLLVVNSTTFMESPLGSDDLFIQKKIKANGEIIPFKDIIDNQQLYLFDGMELEKNFGMVYIENSEDEILNAVIEMNNRILGVEYRSSDVELLNKYHSEFCKKNKWSDRDAPISVNWLKENKGLYL